MNDALLAEELSERNVAQLLREVECYLAAVDVFRGEGREPMWRRETAPALD